MLHCGPLLAESGTWKLEFRRGKSVRFGEKRTLSLRLPKLNRKTAALPSEADIQLILVKGSADDPKRTAEDALKGAQNEKHYDHADCGIILVASWRGSRFSSQSVLIVVSRCRHWLDGVESQAFGRAF